MHIDKKNGNPNLRRKKSQKERQDKGIGNEGDNNRDAPQNEDRT